MSWTRSEPAPTGPSDPTDVPRVIVGASVVLGLMLLLVLAGWLVARGPDRTSGGALVPGLVALVLGLVACALLAVWGRAARVVRAAGQVVPRGPVLLSAVALTGLALMADAVAVVTALTSRADGNDDSFFGLVLFLWLLLLLVVGLVAWTAGGRRPQD